MTFWLPLAKNRFVTFLSNYAPAIDSSDNVKDRYYDALYSTIRRISQNHKVILLGDFNAKVGRNRDILHRVLGHHGVGRVLHWSPPNPFNISANSPTTCLQTEINALTQCTCIPQPRHQRGTVQCHFPIVVPHINDYCIRQHIKPIHGEAGSFISPSNCFEIDSWQHGEASSRLVRRQCRWYSFSYPR